MSSNTVNFTINFDSDADSVFTNISQNIGKVETQAGRLRSTFSKLGESFFIFNQIAQGIQGVKTQLDAVIGPGAAFQQQISDLQAITGITGEDLNTLAKAAREVGKSSGLGASQAAEAFKLLASNIDVSMIGGVEGLKQLQKETITLAHAAGVDLPMAANTMAASINQFKLQAGDASRVINVLAAGAKFGAAEIPDLAESLKYVGPVAGAAGLNIESVTGALEVLSQSAIKGSQAGTDLSGILVKMQTELGVDLSKTGLPAVLEALKPKLSDVTFLTEIFGRENLKSIQTLIAGADQVAVMTDRVTDTNIAYEQAAIRTDTFQNKMAKLTAWFDNFKISIFNATEGMMPFISVASDVVMTTANLGGAIQAFGILAKTQFFTGTMAAVKAVWAFNVALWSNPITWVVAAIAALVAAFVLAWKKLEGFRGFIYALWESIKAVFLNIGNLAKQIFGGLADIITGVIRFDVTRIGAGIAKIGGSFKEFGSAVGGAWTKGFAEGVADFQQDQAAKAEDGGGGVLPGGVINAGGGGVLPGGVTNTGGGGSILPGGVPTTVSGGGRSERSLVINLDSLIAENNNYFDNTREADVSGFMDKLKMALMAVLNDANYAI